jgi:predicted RNase H-like HicB family nuclease
MWHTVGRNSCKAGTAGRIFEEREMRGMKYKVALHASDEGFAVSVPGLPGCWSQGSTEAEALDNIKAAIEEYLAAVDGELKGATIREVEVAA